jgi:hypothetical protein
MPMIATEAQPSNHYLLIRRLRFSRSRGTADPGGSPCCGTGGGMMWRRPRRKSQHSPEAVMGHIAIAGEPAGAERPAVARMSCRAAAGRTLIPVGVVNRCNCCGRRLGLATVSIGIFRKVKLCSSTCKRLYRARWVMQPPFATEQDRTAGGIRL